MSKELVISSNRHETRVALLEDDQLVEVYFQRANEYSLAGSIHKGRVTRVLPGMQSAFVDLGLERDTFLYVSDFLEEEHEDIDRVTGDERPPRENNRDRDRDRDRDSGPSSRDASPAGACGRLPRPPAELAAPACGTAAAAAETTADGTCARPSLDLGQSGRGSRPARTPLAPPPQSGTRIPRIEICRSRPHCEPLWPRRRQKPNPPLRPHRATKNPASRGNPA